MCFQSAFDLLRKLREEIKQSSEQDSAEFCKKIKKTELEIIALLKITESQSEFTEQEIEDLTQISEYSEKLYRLQIFIYERKEKYDYCLKIYLQNKAVQKTEQKQVFDWLNKVFDSLKVRGTEGEVVEK